MHECPDCWQVCTCDGDDTWLDSESETCEHQCEPGDDDPDDFLDEDDEDDEDPGDDDEEDLG